MNGYRRRGVDIIRGGGTARLIEGGRTRSVASGASSRVTLLAEAKSTFTLRFTPAIRRDIERECDRVNHLAYEQLGVPAESGGYLFSHYSPRAEGVKIVYASADASEHTTHSVLLNDPVDVMKAIRAGEHGEYRTRADLRLCGSWHSHPIHDPTPSRQDLENWANRLQRSGADSWVAVIVTPSSPDNGVGWSIPQLHGYRTFWDPAASWGTKPVCSPARIAE
jgi:proteasome lid subunit RPN8/RPN11